MLRCASGTASTTRITRCPLQALVLVPVWPSSCVYTNAVLARHAHIFLGKMCRCEDLNYNAWHYFWPGSCVGHAHHLGQVSDSEARQPSAYDAAQGCGPGAVPAASEPAVPMLPLQSVSDHAAFACHSADSFTTAAAGDLLSAAQANLIVVKGNSREIQPATAKASTAGQHQSTESRQQSRPISNLPSCSTGTTAALPAAATHDGSPRQSNVSRPQKGSASGSQPASLTPAGPTKQPDLSVARKPAATPELCPASASICTPAQLKTPLTLPSSTAFTAQIAPDSLPSCKQELQHSVSLKAARSSAKVSVQTSCCERGTQPTSNLDHVLSAADDISELELDVDATADIPANVTACLASAGKKRRSGQLPADLRGCTLAKKQRTAVGIMQATGDIVVQCTAMLDVTQQVTSALPQPELKASLEQHVQERPCIDIVPMPAAQTITSVRSNPSVVKGLLPSALPIKVALQSSSAAAAACNGISSKRGSSEPAFAGSSAVVLQTATSMGTTSMLLDCDRGMLPIPASGSYRPVMTELPCESLPEPDTMKQAAVDKARPMVIDIDSDSDHDTASCPTATKQAHQGALRHTRATQQSQHRDDRLTSEPPVQLVCPSDKGEFCKKQAGIQQATAADVVPQGQLKATSTKGPAAQPVKLPLGMGDIFSSFSALADLSDAEDEEEEAAAKSAAVSCPDSGQNKAPAKGVHPTWYSPHVALLSLCKCCLHTAKTFLPASAIMWPHS